MVADNASLFEPENAQKMEKNVDPDLIGVEIAIPQGTKVDVLQRINRTLREYPGDVSVSILLPNGGGEPRRMVLPFSINPGEALEKQIKQILGEGAFRRG